MASPVRRLARAAKNAVVDDSFAIRRVRLGLARGARLTLNPRIHAHLILGLYEREVAPWLRRRVGPASVLYDVGASYGYYSVAFGRRMRGGRVYAFEYVDWILELLRQAIEANDLDNRVEIIPLRVGETTDPDAGTLALDDLLDRVPPVRPPDLIKMDVEGEEFAILRGARRLLERHRPHLLVEVHSAALERDCRMLLEEIGYRVSVRGQGRWLRGPRIEDNRWLLADPPPRA